MPHKRLDFHGSLSINPLEALMTALTAKPPGKRMPTPVVDPSHEWSMAQAEVRVKAAGQV